MPKKRKSFAKRATGAKRKSPVRKTAPVRKPRQQKTSPQRNSHLVHRVRGLIFFLAGVFLLFSLYFQVTGIIGDYVSFFVRGIFGILSYAIPIYLICFGSLDFIERDFFARRKSIIFTIIFAFGLLLLFAGISASADLSLSLKSIKESYFSANDLSVSGLFGDFFAMLLVPLIGKVVTIVISCLLILLALLIAVDFKIPKIFDEAEESDIGGGVRGTPSDAVEAFDDEPNQVEEETREDSPPERTFFEPHMSPAPLPIESGFDPPADSAFANDFLVAEPGNDRYEFGQNPDANLSPNKDQQEIIDLVTMDGHVKGEGLQETKRSMENDLTFDEVVGDLENAEAQAAGFTYSLPPVALLAAPGKELKKPDEQILAKMAKRLEDIFSNFRVDIRVTNIIIGPTVTRYEATPMLGVKISNVKALEQDIALNLGVKSVRVITMPGEGMVGIEAYNDRRVTVTLSDILAAPEFAKDKSPTLFGLGKNIAGDRVVADLRNMPHLLIAGTTGSGKSVCINTILLSLLFRAKPDELKFILIDPKVVELAQYNDIPHLLLPVVTEPEKAAIALSHAVSLMEKRYRLFTQLGVRDIDSYNEKVKRIKKVSAEGEMQEYEFCPKIIIVIDELADLMMVASTKVQESISRLAQKARAAGLHLIVATQQPLSSILTSIIKANIPSRIAFAVSSAAASRVIMDKSGAERLLGNGDMLFSPIGSREPKRIQGAFVSDGEIKKVLDFIKEQKPSEYEEEFVKTVERGAVTGDVEIDEDDTLLPAAIEMVKEAKKASTSLLQRRFRIGYNRAARLIDIMEEQGIIGPPDGARPREVLID